MFYAQREEVMQILEFGLGMQGFLDTNLLILVTRNSRKGAWCPKGAPMRADLYSSGL